MSNGWHVSAILIIVIRNILQLFDRTHAPQTKRIRTTINDLVHRWLQPVKISSEVRAVVELPLDRIIQQITKRIDAAVSKDRFGDEPCERPVAHHGVEPRLRHSRALWTRELEVVLDYCKIFLARAAHDTMQPLPGGDQHIHS